METELTLIIRKAKTQLEDAIRGRDYQIYLLSENKYQDEKDLINIQTREKIFQDRVCMLTSLFGTKLD